MAALYEVNTIRPATRINQQGELVDEYEVFFTTAKGDSSFIRVTRTMSAQDMAAAIEAEARKLITLRGG